MLAFVVNGGRLVLLEKENMKAEYKTNVMRILDKAGAQYTPHSFETESAVTGVEAARRIGIEEERVFKTLVTVGKTGKNYVFVIPVAMELDLKKAAAAVGEKNIEMIKSSQLLQTAGYVHGGCSPIGMKKQFTTVVHLTFEQCGTVVFSAGKIGYHVEISPQELKKVLNYKAADITV